MHEKGKLIGLVCIHVNDIFMTGRKNYYQKRSWRAFMGVLMTRPDLSFDVNKLASNIANATIKVKDWLKKQNRIPSQWRFLLMENKHSSRGAETRSLEAIHFATMVKEIYDGKVDLTNLRMYQMCRSVRTVKSYLQGEMSCLMTWSVRLAKGCIRMHWDMQDKVLRSTLEFCLFPIAELKLSNN